jgi:hypothetical protein
MVKLGKSRTLHKFSEAQHIIQPSSNPLVRISNSIIRRPFTADDDDTVTGSSKRRLVTSPSSNVSSFSAGCSSTTVESTFKRLTIAFSYFSHAEAEINLQPYDNSLLV